MQNASDMGNLWERDNTMMDEGKGKGGARQFKRERQLVKHAHSCTLWHERVAHYICVMLTATATTTTTEKATATR